MDWAAPASSSEEDSSSSSRMRVGGHLPAEEGPGGGGEARGGRRGLLGAQGSRPGSRRGVQPVDARRGEGEGQVRFGRESAREAFKSWHPSLGGGVRSSRAVWGEPPGGFLRRVAYLHETSPARERVESRELLRRDGALAAERPPVPPVARHAGVALRGLCLRTRATNERISYGSPLRARGGGSPRSLAWLAARAKLAPRSREWRCARLPTRPLPNPNVQRHQNASDRPAKSLAPTAGSGAALVAARRVGTAMSGVATTTTALLRSKKPLAQFPEFTALRHDVVALREEVAELRESSSKRASRAARREADADDLARRKDAELGELRAQMTALSKAFRALSDVVVDEVEGIKAELASQRSDVAVLQRQLRWTHPASPTWRPSARSSRKRWWRRGRTRRDASARARRPSGRSASASTRASPSARRPRRPQGARRTREEDLHLNHEVLDASRRHQTKLEQRCALLERRAGRTEEALARITRVVAVNAAETNEALRSVRRPTGGGGRGGGGRGGRARASSRANVVGGTSVARRSTGAFDREAMTPVGRKGGGSTLELSPRVASVFERD